MNATKPTSRPKYSVVRYEHRGPEKGVASVSFVRTIREARRMAAALEADWSWTRSYAGVEVLRLDRATGRYEVIAE